jgi:glycogen debranching enzyme
MTADAATIETLWPAILRALAWMDEDGDLDGDGFLEYARRAPDGLVQQGWKD